MQYDLLFRCLANAASWPRRDIVQREKQATIVRAKLSCRIGVWVSSILMSIFAISSRAQEQAPDASPATLDTAVQQVVLGIISFTHWPQPRTPVHLCAVGNTRFSLDGIDKLASPSGPAVATQRASANDPTLGTACDALYIGRLSDAERRQVDANRAGHPVLTIAESDSTCTLGAMFCLTTDKNRVAFDMNLDSVARSGVRVSPKVLELARKRSTP
ncbi:YfiR family protein [Paraburkholderia edwinii]|nr:YfiR family protein [Paraburkholderia edwinii]